MEYGDEILLESLIRLVMQTPDELRRKLIKRMHEEDQRVLLPWLDENCGSYHYELIKKEKHD